MEKNAAKARFKTLENSALQYRILDGCELQLHFAALSESTCHSQNLKEWIYREVIVQMSTTELFISSNNFCLKVIVQIIRFTKVD